MSDLFWLTDAQLARLKPFFLKSHGKHWIGDKWVSSEIIFSNAMGNGGAMPLQPTARTKRSTAAGSARVRKVASVG